MKEISILNRFGLWTRVKWNYDPKINIVYSRKAKKSLRIERIKGIVYEVAPECFWYSTETKKINCGLYK